MVDAVSALKDWTPTKNYDTREEYLRDLEEELDDFSYEEDAKLDGDFADLRVGDLSVQMMEGLKESEVPAVIRKMEDIGADILLVVNADVNAVDELEAADTGFEVVVK